MGQLEGKVALITGAGTGIGKGIARVFAREGAHLILASRNKAKLDETAQEIATEIAPSAVKILVVPTDVTGEEAVKALFAAAMQEFGRIDLLVNNSGIGEAGPLEELALEAWQKVLAVNLTGPFLCAREAMPIMKKQGGGRIINIGSISAQMGRANASPYNTSKYALTGLTKSIALEGRDYNVVCSILHPGSVLTERRAATRDPNDEQPLLSVEEVALTALTMAALPLHVNLLEAIVLPTQQAYLGRG